MVRLVTAVLRILGGSTADPAAVRASISLAKPEERGANLAHVVKAMLLDPQRQIELEDLVLGEA